MSLGCWILTSSSLDFSVARLEYFCCLNRPASHHALNRELASALVAAIDKAETDEVIKAIVITGTGNKAFVPAKTWWKKKTETESRRKGICLHCNR